MSKIDVVRAAMVEAMKAKDKARKDSLSMLLSALKNAQIDKREELTEDEENAVVKKEIRQTQETYDLALISAANWPTFSLLIPDTIILLPSTLVSIPSGSSISTG